MQRHLSLAGRRHKMIPAWSWLPVGGQLRNVECSSTGGRFNIKMASWQWYTNSHYNDKTVSRDRLNGLAKDCTNFSEWSYHSLALSHQSYLYNGNPCHWKDGLYIETEPLVCLLCPGRRRKSHWLYGTAGSNEHHTHQVGHFHCPIVYISQSRPLHGTLSSRPAPQ